jgi:hypothetical protein
MAITFERARQVQDKVESELRTLIPAESIVSIGVGRQHDDFVVAVELNSARLGEPKPSGLRKVGEPNGYELVTAAPRAEHTTLPSEVGGVPVVYELVGSVVAADE